MQLARLCVIINVITNITGGIKMTKKDAIALFKEEYKDFLIQKKKDIPAKREAWAIYTHFLLVEGEITNNQYENWTSLYQ